MEDINLMIIDWDGVLFNSPFGIPFYYEDDDYVNSYQNTLDIIK